MSLLTPTGSLTNNMMANSVQPVPKVGDGATYLGYTDRHPYTVIRVLSPKKIVVQEDDYRRTDNNGQSESQSYNYFPNPNGTTRTLTYRKNGRWVVEGESLKNGQTFSIGKRSKYHDFSF